MAGKMKGKTALVTGAASGIGKEIAIAFARQGANVVVGDVNEKEAMETVRLLEQAGSKSIFIKCDVSNPGSVKSMVEKTVKEFGGLDYACNDAGIHEDVPGSITELNIDMWDRIIAVNLKGVMLCMKEELEIMQKKMSGVIVNVASLAGFLTQPGCYAYTASKHGVMGLTKAAAFEFAQLGIRVNAVCPAVIETPMVAMAPQGVKDYLLSLHPIGRFGKPEEVAATVMWLCDDLSAFVTGTGIVLDGGASTI